MSENFEDTQLNPSIDGERLFSPPKPPLEPSMDCEQPPLEPPKKSFSEDMSNLARKISFDSFAECDDLPGYKKITAGVGVNLPFSSDSTKVTMGVEGRASIFSTPEGAQMTKGVVPSIRATQDLGKNAQLMARVSPSAHEYARIGVQFKF